MRHDATKLGIAAAIGKRGSRRRSRSERLRAAARALTPKHQQDVDVIDEAFANFRLVGSPVAHDESQASERGGEFPTRLTECLSAQLIALERQRSELVQLLRRIDRESQSV